LLSSSAAQWPASHVSAASTVSWSHRLPGPDNGCTPGSYRVLNRAQACKHKTRPDLPATDREQIVAEYGVPNWSGHDGELDHRVPFFLGGKTSENNIWPEPGSIPNQKDKLEFAVFDRVCKARTMRTGTAVAIFRHDWRVTYRRWKATGKL
jgi:hypothetical protein